MTNIVKYTPAAYKYVTQYANVIKNTAASLGISVTAAAGFIAKEQNSVSNQASHLE